MAARRFVHVMRGDEHRQPARRELVNLLPKFAPRLRVHARRRFVEQQQLRLVNQTRREREALFPATGKRAGQLLAPLDHAEAFQTFFHGSLALRHFVEPRDEIQIFLDAQIFVERKFLRHVANAFFYLGALGTKIQTEATAFAAVGREQAAKHPQERGLAAAVRAEEAVNLAGPHLHGDVIDDRACAEFFRHAANVNGEVSGAHFISTPHPPAALAATPPHPPGKISPRS